MTTVSVSDWSSSSEGCDNGVLGGIWTQWLVDNTTYRCANAWGAEGQLHHARQEAWKQLLGLAVFQNLEEEKPRGTDGHEYCVDGRVYQDWDCVQSAWRSLQHKYWKAIVTNSKWQSKTTVKNSENTISNIVDPVCLCDECTQMKLKLRCRLTK